MAKLPLPPGVHIILGDSPGGIFHRTFGSAQKLVDLDDLSCGPTPTCEDQAEWRRIRLAFWKEALVPAGPIGDWTPDVFSIGDSADRLREAPAINIWIGTSAGEQFLVAFTINLAKEIGIEPDRIRLVQFQRTKTGNRIVHHLGELNEENMAAHPEPLCLSPEMRDDYAAAWRALTSPEPRLLYSFSADRPDANPWLRNGVLFSLRQLPDKPHGLPYWDIALLKQLVSGRSKVTRAIGNVIADAYEEGCSVSGDWLAYRLRRMADAGLPQPLLEFENDKDWHLNGQARLTPFGLDVCEGRRSNFPTNPIDDWVAGTRQSSVEGRLWFMDRDGPVPG